MQPTKWRSERSWTGEIGFPAIARVVAQTLDRMPRQDPANVAGNSGSGPDARRVARQVIEAQTVCFCACGSHASPGVARHRKRIVNCDEPCGGSVEYLVVAGPHRRDDPGPRTGAFLGGARVRRQGGYFQLRVRPAPVRVPERRNRLPVFVVPVRRLRQNGWRPAGRRRRQRSRAGLWRRRAGSA